MSDITAVMLEVAQSVAKKAKEDDAPFAERIDALKALTAMYTAMQKHPADPGDDDEDDGFDFSKGVNAREETDGSTVTTLRARRRPD